MATNTQAFKLYFKLGMVATGLYYAYIHKKSHDLRKEYTDFDSI